MDDQDKFHCLFHSLELRFEHFLWYFYFTNKKNFFIFVNFFFENTQKRWRGKQRHKRMVEHTWEY